MLISPKPTDETPSQGDQPERSGLDIWSNSCKLPLFTCIICQDDEEDAVETAAQATLYMIPPEYDQASLLFAVCSEQFRLYKLDTTFGRASAEYELVKETVDPAEIQAGLYDAVTWADYHFWRAPYFVSRGTGNESSGR